MKLRNVIVASAILPIAVFAQPEVITGGTGDFGGGAILSRGLGGGAFLACVISGVFLAYAFQWLLTNLSLAIGISALQGVTDSDKRKKAGKDSDGRVAQGKREGEEDDWEDTAVKIGSGVGIWAMITCSIALFLAGWLAVGLIRAVDGRQGLIMGLVIWSVFMGTMMYLESLAATSLLGFITGMVRNGLGALAAPFKSVAGKLSENRNRASDREQSVQTAQEIAAAVRKEMFGTQDWHVEGPGIQESIRDFVQSNLKPKVERISHFGESIKSLLTDPELVEMVKKGELQNLDRSHFAEIVAGRTDLDKHQVERTVDTLHGAWTKFLGENAPAKPEGIADEADVPASHGVMAKYKGFREFLKNTGREELKPERLEQEIKTLVLDPKAGLAQLMEHIKELDRDSLVELLSQRKDFTPEEAARVADQIDLARSKALSAKEEAEHRTQEIKDSVLSKIRDHVYSLNRPELDYDGFEADFKRLLDDPKAAYASLKSRLGGLDRDSLVALLGSIKGIDSQDAEKMVAKGEAVKGKAEQVVDQAKSGMGKIADRILEAKEAVLERARQVEEEAERRLERAKRISLEQAEAARKVTAAAAWWMLAIALVSGAAAALGGYAGAGYHF